MSTELLHQVSAYERDKKAAFTIRAPNASGVRRTRRWCGAQWTSGCRSSTATTAHRRPQLPRRSADQPAQPVGLTLPGVPALIEFVADQLANLEQPVDLRLHQIRFSPFHGDCVPFH